MITTESAELYLGNPFWCISNMYIDEMQYAFFSETAVKYIADRPGEQKPMQSF